MVRPQDRRPWDLPPLYLLLAVVLMTALHVVLPLAALLATPARAVGVLLIVGGVALAIWGERTFKAAGTAVRPFEPSSAMVEAGPFRFTRNPMYLGMFLILGGVATVTGSLTPWLVLPAFVLLIRNRFVLNEEAHMREHFGAAYDAYTARVRRWI